MAPESPAAHTVPTVSPLLAAGVLVGIVLVATAAGVLWRARTGRVRTTSGECLTPAELGQSGSLGSRATLVQFSTEFCAPCVSTRRYLSALAERNAGVRHLDVDLTERADLAARFNVLQTPTTLILDSVGRQRGRIAGAPRPEELIAAVNRIVEGEDVGIR